MTNPARPRLRFAVLCDSPSLERWQSSALRDLIATGASEPVAIIALDSTPRERSADGGILSSIVQPAERETSGSIYDFFAASGTQVSSFDIKREDASALARFRLDFILYLGFGPSDPGLAHFAVYGLWRYRFGDMSKYENYPPGVWEVIAGDLLTVATLCRVHAYDRDATVLRSGVFATIGHLPNANASQVLAEASQWPAYAARNIWQTGEDETAVSCALKNVPQPLFPPLMTRALLAFRLLTHKIRRLPNLFFEDRWNVGLVDEAIDGFLQSNASRRVAWFPNSDRNLYLADPMGAIVDGKRIVLCETFDYRTRLGSISALAIDDRGWIPSISPMIPLAVHASYPFLFMVGADLYCVPETSQAGHVALYKATDAGDGFQRIKVLLASTPCADPTLFQHDGYWWLLCTDAVAGEHTRLLAWYAKDILDDFTPHPQNPVKIDVRSARPAGTPFVHEGRLFRPSQDCSRTYGGAVTINEITHLSPTRFREVPVASVGPIRRSGYGFGIHTLSSLGAMTLIDSKRRTLTGSGLREKLDVLLAKMKAG